MSFSTILFTDKGRALQSKVLAGVVLNFTRIGMGSGSLGGQSQITLNALIEPKVYLTVSQVEKSGNYATVKGNFRNADISTGFYWREFGIFAQDPDLGEILYCYSNASSLAEYIPPQSSEIIEKVVGLSVIVGDTANVTILTDPAAFATKAEVAAVSDKADQAFQAAGNPSKVNGHTVESDVPENAKFTDTVYTHPTGDGNSHVPATGTSNNGKFLKAGTTANSSSWQNIGVADVNGAAPLASPAFTGTPTAPTSTDYTTLRLRNIQASTTDLTAGSSTLANGNIYMVYE